MLGQTLEGSNPSCSIVLCYLLVTSAISKILENAIINKFKKYMIITRTIIRIGIGLA
jgi:hypothetical protein